MPVVINEFEVIERSPQQVSRAAEAPATEGEAARPVDALEVGAALRAIEVHVMRAWAH